ncbi:hypothetical protein [Thalassobaculum sp.]|uniref:hypothetical protein n=1 Tax=Thalassobaculum sp. TaxID=2022740 RepID=UPI0032EBA938
MTYRVLEQDALGVLRELRSTDDLGVAISAMRHWYLKMTVAGYDTYEDARHGNGIFAIDASGRTVVVYAVIWIEYPDEDLLAGSPSWLPAIYTTTHASPRGLDIRDVADTRRGAGSR